MTTRAVSLNGLRLLVVEDEAMVAMLIEGMLQDFGCVVVNIAGSVAEGLALIDDHDLEIDGAVLDVNLGGEMVFPIAAELTRRAVPFIFSTGYGRAGIIAEYAAVPTLSKPFSSDALETMLMSAVIPRN